MKIDRLVTYSRADRAIHWDEGGLPLSHAANVLPYEYSLASPYELLGWPCFDELVNFIRNPLGVPSGGAGSAPVNVSTSINAGGPSVSWLGPMTVDGIEGWGFALGGTSTAVGTVQILLEAANVVTQPSSYSAADGLALGFYTKLLGGSTALLLSSGTRISEYNADNSSIATGSQTGLALPTTEPAVDQYREQSRSSALSASAAYARPILQWGYQAGEHNAQIFIGAPRFRPANQPAGIVLPAAGTVATSYRRAGLLAYAPRYVASQLNPLGGMTWVEFLVSGVSPKERVIVQRDDGTDASRVALVIPAGTLQVEARAYVGGVLVGVTGRVSTITPGVVSRAGLRAVPARVAGNIASQIGVCLDGGEIQSVACALPTCTARLVGRARAAGAALDGWVQDTGEFNLRVGDGDFRRFSVAGA
ncbi:hypothetical protein [Roseomonas xinghualingensis]|uniref:hypothetical protein n=1 Tax=Roseomonas xinghualingensis TaxID=2986475 RepID=UPI0021F0BFD9|nr:hypothetical protein [Roseomonas sp. SXEYE001]MCV4209996.1 hypothetical protein [Roseomonas sp. SXEYE001]